MEVEVLDQQTLNAPAQDPRGPARVKIVVA